MATLPRPLLALLAAVLVFFAAWTLVLKPHSSTGSSASTAVPAPRAVVVKPTAHPAAAGASATARKPSHAAAAASAKPAAAHRRPSAAAHVAPAPQTAQARATAVLKALSTGKVLALLFYNPQGADDNAMRQELSAVPTASGKVVDVAVPIQELSRYSEVTDQVPVTGSPTLIVIDRRHHATTLVGFADQLEVNQRVAAAVAAR